jgi:hypothetical protein
MPRPGKSPGWGPLPHQTKKGRPEGRPEVFPRLEPIIETSPIRSIRLGIPSAGPLQSPAPHDHAALRRGLPERNRHLAESNSSQPAIFESGARPRSSPKDCRLGYQGDPARRLTTPAVICWRDAERVLAGPHAFLRRRCRSRLLGWRLLSSSPMRGYFRRSFSFQGRPRSD